LRLDFLQHLKTREDAKEFLDNFGSHYSENRYHYGGINIFYEQQITEESSVGNAIGDNSKISVHTKLQTPSLIPVQVKSKLGCEKSALETSSEQHSKRTYSSKSRSCVNFDESQIKEYEEKIAQNPKWAKIISRGPMDELIPVWEYWYIKKYYPDQAKILRETWIMEVKSNSEFIRSLKTKFQDQISTEKAEQMRQWRNRWDQTVKETERNCPQQ
jgi:hypothetical protein